MTRSDPNDSASGESRDPSAAAAQDTGKPAQIPSPDGEPASPVGPAAEVEAERQAKRAAKAVSDRQPDEPPLVPGTRVEHFEVIRQIGGGGMAVVYLALDTKLGRKVALKMVRPARARSPRTTRRFLQEARATARFSHPHIVAIHAVGEYKGLPYVALEYVEGQTLRKRIGEGTLGIMQTMRIGLAIAEALHQAHEEGIVHADLKPENVLIARDGRPRILDFGLARVIETDHTSDGIDLMLADSQATTATTTTPPTASSKKRIKVAGTPAYMAPEQWRNENVTGAADIWSLGLILGECAAHWRPYSIQDKKKLFLNVIEDKPVPLERLQEALPQPLVTLIEQCLAKHADQRPNAEHVAIALRQLLGGGDRVRSTAELPFIGLSAFTHDQTHLFFGRDQEIGAAVERLRDQPVLPIVGPTGAGKTSLVHAGIIPRLEEQGRYVIIATRPGNEPFKNLAAALAAPLCELPTMDVDSSPATAANLGDPQQLAEHMIERPQRLALLLRRIAHQQQTQVLLVVDQLEEIATLVDNPLIRQRYVSAVCTAADDRDDPVRVLLTLRDDFLGRLADTSEARRVLSRLMVVRSPGVEAMEQILTEPVRALGYRYDDPSLVNRIIDEIRGEPACLPLLQVAGQMLWERRDRDSRVLPRAAFDELGGVGGALATHADGVLAELSPDRLRVAREILLRLVTAEGTRRILSAHQVLDGLPEQAPSLLRMLIEGRLVSSRTTLGDDWASSDGELELVHESLIDNWRTLARWVESSREELRVIEEIGQAAELWRRRGEKPDELWRGDALKEAQRVVERGTTQLPEGVQRFLGRSTQQERSRKRRRRGLIFAGIASLLLITAAAVVAALTVAEQERLAQQQKERARARWADAQREAARAAMLRHDLLEARARLRGALEIRDTPMGRALWARLARHPMLWRRQVGGIVYDVVISPDGRTIAAAGQNRVIYLIDADTRRTSILRGHSDQVFGVDFASRGRRLISGSLSGEVRIWQLPSGKSRVLSKLPHSIRALQVSPDDAVVAVTTSNGALLTIRLADGQQRIVRRGGSPLNSLAFSIDGQAIAAAGAEGTIRIWPRTALTTSNTDKPPVPLAEDLPDVQALAFNRTGTVLAAGLGNGQVRIWRLGERSSADAGKPLRYTILDGHHDSVRGLCFTRNDRYLVSGSVDRRIRVWDLVSGETHAVLEGHSAAVYALACSKTTDALVSASSDHSVRLWDLAVGHTKRGPGPHSGAINAIALSADRKLAATAGADRTARLWDLNSGQVLQVYAGHSNVINDVAFSPDGTLLATAGWDRTIRLWDRRRGTQVMVIGGHQAPVTSVTFIDEGRALVSGSRDRTIRIWEIRTGKERARLLGHTDAVAGLAVSGDGRTLASASYDRSIRIWDLRQGVLKRTLIGHTDRAFSVMFHPIDRNSLASASFDHTVRIWDLRSGSQRIVGRHQGRAYQVSFSSDGRRLFSAGADQKVRVWALSTSQSNSTAPSPLLEIGHRDEVNDIAVVDGDHLLSAGDDGTLRLWRNGKPVWRGIALLGPKPHFRTHKGWLTAAGIAPPPATNRRWLQRIERETDFTSGSADGRWLCLLTHSGIVELWDRQQDRRLQQSKIRAERIVARNGACLALSTSGQAMLILPAETRQLARQATAIGGEGKEILVATHEKIFVYDAQGTPLRRIDGREGAVSIARIDGQIALGFVDGNIELLPAQQAAGRTFDNVPSSAVVLLLPGPAHTLIAGHANGVVGMWSIETGVQLEYAHLHGAAAHQLATTEFLLIGSEMGDWVRWDLSPLHAKWCDLLKDIWRHVTVAWEAGRPVKRPPPRGHPCNALGQSTQ
ncbi:MAG: protein kinase [Deltaproteobacteria bacterium]|nr:protein kinase [Deltaproteobacteria bacterium]